MDSIIYEMPTVINEQEANPLILDGECTRKLKENLLKSPKWNEEKIKRLFRCAINAVMLFPTASDGQRKYCV